MNKWMLSQVVVDINYILREVGFGIVPGLSCINRFMASWSWTVFSDLA